MKAIQWCHVPGKIIEVPKVVRALVMAKSKFFHTIFTRLFCVNPWADVFQEAIIQYIYKLLKVIGFC